MARTTRRTSFTSSIVIEADPPLPVVSAFLHGAMGQIVASLRKELVKANMGQMIADAIRIRTKEQHRDQRGAQLRSYEVATMLNRAAMGLGVTPDFTVSNQLWKSLVGGSDKGEPIAHFVGQHTGKQRTVTNELLARFLDLGTKKKQGGTKMKPWHFWGLDPGDVIIAKGFATTILFRKVLPGVMRQLHTKTGGDLGTISAGDLGRFV